MAIRPDEIRQCRAVLRSETEGDLHCQGEVTEQTTHIGDHWAYVDDKGNKAHWTEAVAVYPAATRDSQVGGDHYRKFKIQPWDVIDEYGLSYYEGQILKYLLRRKANRVEDLKKARHVLDKAIELEEGGDGSA
jgi:hypothetical protein